MTINSASCGADRLGGKLNLLMDATGDEAGFGLDFRRFPMTNPSASGATPNSPSTKLGRVIASAIIGSTLEWYDFFLYATASALVFGKVFFTAADPTVGTLLSFATLGVGFLARPLGAMILGGIGDKIGRQPALVASLVIMGIASTLIGVLPGYDMIGIWAPLLLVVLRLVQGFAAGGELAGATILSAEYAPPNRRGLFGSYAAIGTYAGTVLSSGIFMLFSLMPSEAFLSWGWRIPFLLSALVVVIGIYIRLRVGETPVFTAAVAQKQTTKVPLLDMLRYEWPRMLLLIGLVAGAFTATYAYQVYSLSYISGVLKLPGTVGTLSVTIAALVACFVVPLAGYLSDRIGRKPVIIAGALFSAVWAFPFFWLADTQNTVFIVIAMLGGVGIGVPTILGVQGVVFSGLFKTGTRFTGYALSRELGSIAFAGATPFVAASLVGAAGGQAWPVSLYVVGACVITFIAALFIREQSVSGTTDELAEVSAE